MKKRYLSLCSREEALSLMSRAFPPPGTCERVPLLEAEGRITAEPVYAPCTVPETRCAGMDGIAVRSAETFGAGEQRPVAISDYVMVDTGNPIPPEYDAIVMIEDVFPAGESRLVRKAALPGQYIRPAGEDIREGDLVLPRGHQIRPSDISALATYGYDHVLARVIRVGILPVGNELVPIGTRPARGKIVESNSVFAGSYLSRMGARCTRYEIVPDDPLRITKCLCRALRENDLVLISSGTSAGRADHTSEIISSLGTLLFHGVAMMPGKPVMVGNLKGKPVVGLPGYPVASQTALRELVVPFLVRWGLAGQQAAVLPARLARNIPSELGFDEFIPVSVGSIAGCTWAHPHPRGSGLQMNLVRANGYLHVPAFSEGLDTGTVADIHLTTAPYLVDRVLLCTGTRESGVALLADALAGRDISMHIFPARPIELIPALRMNSCHIGIQSVPEINGVSGIRQVPGDLQLMALHIGKSQIGLVSRDTISADDLGRIRVVNAPRESARRIVLDWLLAELGLSPDQVAGYSSEARNGQVMTETIIHNRADAGIGSSALAASAGLRFLPIVPESLELLVRNDALDDCRIQALQDVVKSVEFQDLLQQQGGYFTTKTGQIRELSPGFDRVGESREEGIRQP